MVAVNAIVGRIVTSNPSLVPTKPMGHMVDSKWCFVATSQVRKLDFGKLTRYGPSFSVHY